MMRVLTEMDRQVTDEEVEFYQENGWVMLRNLVSAEATQEILRRLKQRMGTSGDQPDDPSRARSPHATKIAQAVYFARYLDPSEEDEVLRAVACSKEIGRNVQRLMGRDVPIRKYADLGACKIPASWESGSDETLWHQDHPSQPFDRTGLQIWLALIDMTPEMGTMRFIAGSQREGMLGRGALGKDDQALFDLYPRLRRYQISAPLFYRAGDATVHNGLTVHGAPENTSDTPRWAYIRAYMSADALYTRAENAFVDPIGLDVNKPFDHPRFPIICP